MIPTGAATALWFGWMMAFGYTTDALDDGPSPINLGLVSMLLLGYGCATILAVLTHRLLRRAMLARRATAYLGKQVCLRCGYSLAGLSPERGPVKCPECGYASPA